MKRFVQGQERSQGTLFPVCLDEYISDDNPVRVIDVFVDELNLRALGFDGVVPQTTGRPAYHPAALLKIYIYGYLNRIPSSRRLEQETSRNLELIWLTGQLQPDHKTIARFRKDNGPAIRAVCRQFVGLCRKLNLFSQAVVAIDGSKFKVVNARDKNFTPAKIAKRIEQVEASIAHYLSALDTADRQERELAQEKAGRLKDKIAALREQMQQFRELEQQVLAAPDQQISLTDPDARAMATRGIGTGVVGYNVQAAVDVQHHLIVAHEVTNSGSDRGQLSGMAQQARTAMGTPSLEALADRGYYKGEDILACERAGITPSVPKTLSSGAKAEGRFGKQDFVYHPEDDTYRCPAGERLTRRCSTVEHGMLLHLYWTTCCERCALKEQCTTGKQRRIKRWEHEDVLDAMQERLDRAPETTRLRRQTVEHPFGTIKAWMGATHFLTRTLERVRTEMSLHVLAYNLKRVLAILGPGPLMAVMRV
ncbi:IS1182 family transposase [Microvirga sp. VF16]|uniref:IS1182 family transposase n=1 Tax=Microvirga sp. VF16 TaxID=2807101 RepID=UPI00193D4571|nr:IS1182 family transposase [Microvirga sp. VF16]QRM28500.1 IS1182 family transposase [Microvirga sp. VF16]